MNKLIPSWLSLRVLGLLLVLLPAAGMAQSMAPALVIQNNDKPEPLYLAKLAVDVRIFGLVAETRMTMTFSNPHERQLSGDLYFPLPEGATVSGYALDINGVMVDGVVVEKEKGRQVFESLTRKRIDPGLVEWVKGNSFKTRVFPIPARGSRTIMVRYISELFSQKQAIFFQLPLNFTKKIKEISLRVEVAKGSLKPKIKSRKPGNFAFKKWQQNYIAEARFSDIALPQNLVIEIPDAEKPKVTVEKNPEGEYYFMVSSFPRGNTHPIPDALVVPEKITIFWDASGSRAKTDHTRELDFLHAYFTKFKQVNISVTLLLFRNACEKPQNFQVENGNSEKLLAKLGKVDYDGGTQTGSLSPSAATPMPDHYFLFSDGISNFGKEEPVDFNAPVYVFSGDIQANHPFLHHLAESSGGQYFNLNQVPVAEAVNQMGKPVLRFVSAISDQARISDTYPRSAQAVAGKFVLAGKLLADEGKIVVNFGHGSRINEKIEYRVSKADAVSGELLATLWAQKKIEELLIFSRRNDKELIEVGKKYGLVTPGTSLIVLDNLNQYIEYRIMPPESLPDMRRQYSAIMERRTGDFKRFEDDKIKNILLLWANRSEWWNTDFSKPQKTQIKNIPDKQTSPSPFVRTPPTLPTSAGYYASLTHQGNANILGSAKLADGLAIPGASVTLKDRNGDQVVVFTDGGGHFRFIHFPAGVYDLKIEFEGFKTIHYKKLRLKKKKNCILNIPMERSAVHEEIIIAPVVSYKAAREVEGGVEGGIVGGVLGGVEGGSEMAGAALASAAPDSTFGNNKTTEPVISIQAWDPQVPYLQALKTAAGGDEYAVYLEQRKKYEDSPGFFLDCGDFFFAQNKVSLGLQILSNIAELELENAALLRVLGHRLEQLALLDLSAMVFEEVLKMRSEEPQSYRDLALVLAAQKKYERAIELLNHVVMGKWDRFAEIELTALIELNNIIVKAKIAGLTEFKVSPQIIIPMDLDIRIVMTWDTDMTDLDLWVTEPTEEKAFYSHNRTTIGGLISKDFTDGYGPEEYLIRKAMHGVYKIQADYFGSSSQNLIGPVTLQVDIFTDWGRPNEKKKSLTLRLAASKDILTIGEIEF